MLSLVYKGTGGPGFQSRANTCFIPKLDIFAIHRLIGDGPSKIS